MTIEVIRGITLVILTVKLEKETKSTARILRKVYYWKVLYGLGGPGRSIPILWYWVVLRIYRKQPGLRPLLD